MQTAHRKIAIRPIPVRCTTDGQTRGRRPWTFEIGACRPPKLSRQCAMAARHLGMPHEGAAALSGPLSRICASPVGFRALVAIFSAKRCWHVDCIFLQQVNDDCGSPVCRSQCWLRLWDGSRSRLGAVRRDASPPRNRSSHGEPSPTRIAGSRRDPANRRGRLSRQHAKQAKEA